jgi:hypothetical protein
LNQKYQMYLHYQMYQTNQKYQMYPHYQQFL